MPSNTSVDQYNSYYSSQPRRFLTPPPTWKTSRCSPVMPGSEKKPIRSPQGKTDLFHVFHKVPSGDSPYGRAKHVQLVDKDPSRAVSMFWAAINSGDRIDSALKDMAVVMKQLDRSDEAIEAIKSFRHLCPLESQESLDNILVELYKKSGRIEEEIEMLKLKLKQVEDGTAFGGQRTKTARSQGRKFQITVEKDYSRLVGNLAWAYMQLKDFKSAEEQYRKALSIEPDKNKQCNLAMCLMHMNKLTEAKFLLQATGISSDGGPMDESYAKSYERASQMLVELEAGGVLEPLKQTDIRLSFKNMNLGALPKFPYEKRSDFDWKKNHCRYNVSREEADCVSKRVYGSPFYGKIPKVPFTQPRSGNQRNAGLTEKAYNGGFCRKLSFGQSAETETELALKYNEERPKNLSIDVIQLKPDAKEILDGGCLKEVENSKSEEILTGWKKSPDNGGFCRKLSFGQSAETETELALKYNEERLKNLSIDVIQLKPDAKEILDGGCLKEVENSKSEEILTGWKKSPHNLTCIRKKSWADMVEEEEEASKSWRIDFPQEDSGNYFPESLSSYRTPGKMSGGSVNKGRHDENANFNVISQPENLSRPSLCYFDQYQNPGATQNHCASPLTLKVLNFEGKGLASSDDLSSTKSINRRNRLQVFQDITHVSASPGT